MTSRALAVLRAVAASIAPDGGPDLGDRVAAKIATLPRPADRAELDLLLRLFESRVLNLVLAGVPRPFTALSPGQRERYLRGWGTSGLAGRRETSSCSRRARTGTKRTSRTTKPKGSRSCTTAAASSPRAISASCSCKAPRWAAAP